MKDFIIYRHSSGEFIFVRRKDISSFKPVFVNKHQYRILVTVGPIQVSVAEVASLEEAEKWVMEQIERIDNDAGAAPAKAK